MSIFSMFSKKRGMRFCGLLWIGLAPFSLSAQEGKEEEPRLLTHENQTCFSCHGKSHYQFISSDSSKFFKREMCPNNVVDSALFYSSNHKTFTCVDCHDPAYSTYPHPSSLKGESMWACMDCHGYDEKYAKFKFEELTTQFEQSIHYKADPDAFTCWQCHDPHAYKTMARENGNIAQTVRYDNNICLTCHGNVNRMEVLTDKDKAGVIEKHEWLPNQELHFRNVRCVECHSQFNDSVVVSHLILPKDRAVRKCAECHSKNSMLLATLYKFQVKENRQKYGFLNPVILNDSFVIGANRNYYLNVVSITIGLLVFIAIGFHAVLRILKHNKS